MTKSEKIQAYIKKVATKHDVSCEEAEKFKLTQEYIKYIEKED